MTAPVAANEIKRDILGLYDSSDEKSADHSRLHRWLEMPLNHLGYKLTLHDVSRGLPAVSEMRRFHAVATWFNASVADPKNYLSWATAVARTGVKFVVLENVGALGNKEELPAINAFLNELSLSYALYYVGDTAQTKIRAASPMIGFERRLEAGPLPGHQVIVAKSSAVARHLVVSDPAHKWAGASDAVLVATHPRGGLIASGFAVHYDSETKRISWIVDPFQFLATALGPEQWPIPDTTTVSGRRLYFSHIDGDGWLNATEVQPYVQRGGIASDVLLDRLIAPYPDLPVSVGLIAGDVDPRHGGRSGAAANARRMFELSQVEVASHTHTHPYAWSFYENYRRDAEMKRLESYVETSANLADRSIAAMVRSWQLTRASAISSDTVQPPLLPRARPGVDFDLSEEVAGALKVSTNLAPANKPARLYLWSGDTRPFEAAVRATREQGVKNLNGGDSRFDASYPSAAYVAPLSRIVGNERQIYAVNSNENTYTNGWTGPFDAFKTLTETVANTETPRRLKGFNLYYHSYAATKQVSLDVVIGHLEAARAGRLTPITASNYAGIAEGFFSARIVKAGPRAWKILDRGALDTVRFEAGAGLAIDYAASQGVIGHTSLNGVMYVALDAAVTEPVIALASTARGAALRAAQPHLSESRWQLSAVSRDSCGINATAQGFGAGDMAWLGMSPGNYTVSTSRAGVPLSKTTAVASNAGQLTLRLTDDAIAPLQLRIACERRG